MRKNHKNQPETSKFNEFLEKNRENVKRYTAGIWILFFLLMIIFATSAPDKLTQEEMQQQVDEKCDNLIILPPDGEYQVRFDYSYALNKTTCEVIYNGE